MILAVSSGIPASYVKPLDWTGDSSSAPMFSPVTVTSPASIPGLESTPGLPME